MDSLNTLQHPIQHFLRHQWISVSFFNALHSDSDSMQRPTISCAINSIQKRTINKSNAYLCSNWYFVLIQWLLIVHHLIRLFECNRLRNSGRYKQIRATHSADDERWVRGNLIRTVFRGGCLGVRKGVYST